MKTRKHSSVSLAPSILLLALIQLGYNQPVVSASLSDFQEKRISAAANAVLASSLVVSTARATALMPPSSAPASLFVSALAQNPTNASELTPKLPSATPNNTAPVPTRPSAGATVNQKPTNNNDASAQVPGEPKAVEPKAVEPKAVALSAQFNIVPFLVAGHPCTLSVTDAEGRPLDRAGVFLGEELFCSDAKGLITFTVPDTESFELFLIGEGKKKIGKRKFVRGADRVYSDNDKLADIAAALLKIDSPTDGAPLVLYAPAVLSPGVTFVIVGRNLSETIANDYIDIDGASAKILSASADGVLAKAPTKLSLGRLRELFMTVDGQASNAAETDIAIPFFTHEKTEDDDVSPEKGKIGMNGTNVPCLIRVRNNDIENVSLWSPNQEPLGKSNIMLSPGGDQNYLNIDFRILHPKTEPKLELSLEQELNATSELAQTPPQLLTSLCRAEILRMERSRIALNFRLDGLRKKEPAASTIVITPADSEKYSAERKALSTRLRRLSIMLAARKVIYESLGNTDAQYRQALDDASGGALFTLDQSIKQIQIVSDGSVGIASSELKSLKSSNKKGRPLRLLEPAIHLLPPMNEAQLAVMNTKERTSSGSSNTAEIKQETPGQGSSSSLDQTLRPSLPEPEPEVSANNRASSTGLKTDKTTIKTATPDKEKKAVVLTQPGDKTAKKIDAKKTTEPDKIKTAGKKDALNSSHSKAKDKHSKDQPAVHSRRRHGSKSDASSDKKSGTSSKRHRRHHRSRTHD